MDFFRKNDQRLLLVNYSRKKKHLLHVWQDPKYTPSYSNDYIWYQNFFAVHSSET